ncbi:MAG: hypothetical protein Q6353_016300 [Candidatus Sigynarchaeum springense]
MAQDNIFKTHDLLVAINSNIADSLIEKRAGMPTHSHGSCCGRDGPREPVRLSAEVMVVILLKVHVFHDQ